MASFRAKCLLLLLLVALAEAYPSNINVVNSGDVILQALREVTDQSQNKTDTLNLPANASSIRENITDTFSCENRTYGYYADIDNDCQVFHVCLPSQTPSGRNVTYRWSFICPNETVFNQEVLTCTRIQDSVDCKTSDMYYHLNMEFGKVSNKTEAAKKDRRILKRKQDKRKENIVLDNMVIENVIKDIVQDEIKERRQAVELGVKSDEGPTLIEGVIDSSDPEIEDVELEQRKEEEMDRIIMERNMRDARNMKRGAFRFINDAY